ncbi:MAG: HAD-IB family hydrolase [Halioglobus sp.]
MGQTSLETHCATLHTAQKKYPAVAFFDLDGTLIAGYSIIALAWETAREMAGSGNLATSAKLVRDLLRQKSNQSGTSYHRVVRRLTRMMAGMSEQRLEQLGERAYHNLLAKSLFKEAVALIESHRAAGHHLVMVTAATRYQAAPLARVLGIDELCCTELEVIDGHFSGKVIAPMCYGEGKSMAARRVAKQRRSALEHCWFYTDSSADLPLLKEVGHPVAVNPSDRLEVLARSNGWPQLCFRSRGMPTVESLARTALTVQAVAASTTLAKLGQRVSSRPTGSANRLTRLLGDVASGCAGLDYEVEGYAHLRTQRPAIYIFNHQSLLDAVVLAHLLREDVVPLCKAEMANNPIVGPILKRTDTIFVHRDEKDQKDVLQRALAVLESGRSLVIAPEGTRSTLGNIQPFKHGAFFLAKKAKVPIIPIVLHNVKDALPKGGLLIRPATIRITVLSPLAPQDMGTVRQTCHRIESQFCAQLADSRIAALPLGETA